jgi:Fe-S-cluster containining protein
MGGTEYHCQHCGACCLDPEGGEAYAWLDRAEANRMRRRGLTVVAAAGKTFLGTRARSSGGRACVAFRGQAGGPCHCAVYEDRPGVCRRFHVGDRLCRMARVEAGLPE